jgi:hypothetical protein
MNWSSSIAWLAALAAPDHPQLELSDPADMGTAFGLDASMLSAGDGAYEATGRPADQALEPWERRIVRRSSL